MTDREPPSGCRAESDIHELSAELQGEHTSPVVGSVPDHRNRVQSVQRACAILRGLSSGPVPCSTQLLANRVGLDRTVVRRLLKTLELEGLVVCSKQRWQLGGAAAAFGNAYLDADPLYDVALRHAVLLHDHLSTRRPWVVNVAIPVGSEAVLIARFPCPSAPLDNVLRAGSRLPMGESALGRAMLAFLSNDAQRAILGADMGREFSARASVIRSRGGVEIVVEPLRPGISAIAAAIHGEGCNGVAAIGISGPTKALPLSPGSDLADRLRGAAARVAREYQAMQPQAQTRRIDVAAGS